MTEALKAEREAELVSAEESARIDAAMGLRMISIRLPECPICHMQGDHKLSCPGGGGQVKLSAKSRQPTDTERKT